MVPNQCNTGHLMLPLFASLITRMQENGNDGTRTATEKQNGDEVGESLKQPGERERGWVGGERNKTHK